MPHRVFASSRQNLPLCASLSARAPTASVSNKLAEGSRCLPGGIKPRWQPLKSDTEDEDSPLPLARQILPYLDCSQTSELKGLSKKMIFHLSEILAIHYAEYLRSRGRRMTLKKKKQSRGLPHRVDQWTRTRRRTFPTGGSPQKSSCQLQRFGQKTQPFSIKN